MWLRFRHQGTRSISGFGSGLGCGFDSPDSDSDSGSGQEVCRISWTMAGGASVVARRDGTRMSLGIGEIMHGRIVGAF